MVDTKHTTLNDYCCQANVCGKSLETMWKNDIICLVHYLLICTYYMMLCTGVHRVHKKKKFQPNSLPSLSSS
jgi:hypothetical protein